ncbi:MAG: undecaprenyl-diphosphate phosphatase [bacterium]
MSFMQSILLGIIQGLTEFFPVSSSGHLVIIESFFKNFYRPGLLFEILLHLATLLPVVIYYRKELYKILEGLWDWKADSATLLGSPGRKLLFMLFIGSIPTAMIGFAFKDLFEQLFSTPFLVLLALCITGGLLWFASRRPHTDRPLEDMTIRDAVFIGIFQGLAITPGISRSGATIAMGLFCGLDPEASAAYSFLLSIPAISGAALLEMKDSVHLLWQPESHLMVMLAGALFASIVGYLAIRYLVKLLAMKRLSFFAWYCWFFALSVGLFLFVVKM